MDFSLPGSSVHDIRQARILQWIAIHSSRGSSWPRDQIHVSCGSCLARHILCCWATREAIIYYVPDIQWEKEMATHSSILAWRIPWTEEPGGLLFMWSHRVGHDWSNLATAIGIQFCNFKYYGTGFLYQMYKVSYYHFIDRALRYSS